MHKYFRNIGDYAKDTRHLSLLEHGAYTMMLDIAYTSEAPLPTDRTALFRLCCARSKDDQKAVETVLQEFFTEQENGWIQKRVQKEIADYVGTSDTKRFAVFARMWAKEFGKKKPIPCIELWLSHLETFYVNHPAITRESPDYQMMVEWYSHVSLTKNQEPETKNQKPFSLAAGAADGDTLIPNLSGIGEKKKGAQAVEIYEAYPRKVARDAALKAIEKRLDQGMDAQELLDATCAYAAATQRWEVGDRQFIPHPATWFNAGGFADDQREWNRGGAPAAKKEKAVPVEEEPPGWWDAWALCWPDVPVPGSWHGIAESFKTELRIKLEDMAR